MSEIWNSWESQVVEHKYRLEALIGSTDHSAVFRAAEYRSPEPRKATLKFMDADIPSAEQVLAGWSKAAQLSHPNLQRILQTGRCKIDGRELLYVAMEHADENLAEIIPQRPLAPHEAREALNAIVDVLVYLHGKGLTHGHICPANILAVGEFLKVASDTIEPLGERREMTRDRGEYDAPEIPAEKYTQAADIWSLGVTLVEMLTQQRDVLPFRDSADAVIPQSVGEPFLEIARHALRKKPERRWTSAQIAERLNPSALVAKAAMASAGGATASASASTATAAPSPSPAKSPQAASTAPASSAKPAVPPEMSPAVSPPNVPLSKEPAIPLAKHAPVPAPPIRVTAPRPNSAKRETLVLPNYAIPLFVVALILVAVIALPRILRNRTVAAPGTNTASVPPDANPRAPADATRPAAVAPQKAPKTPDLETAKNMAPAPPPVRNTAVPAAAPALMRSNDTAPAAKPRNSRDVPGRGEVLDEALPQIPAKALATISGTVRVVVKAHVDAAGQVASTELQEAGPSHYFADKAVLAAQRWLFTSPEANGRSLTSDWLIRFEYTRDGVKAFPQQLMQ
jgi:serine/threonine protein kinase